MQSLWMLAAALSFSSMAALVKLAAPMFGAAEILFYRCLISTLLVGTFVWFNGYSVLTSNWVQHSRRAACGTFSMGVWYYTLGVLPITTSVTLNYASPIFIGVLTAISGFRAGRPPSSKLLYVALGVGFLGVVILLNPKAAPDQLAPMALGLFAAFIAAFAFQDVKRLVQLGEPEWRLVFYFSLYSTIFAFIAMFFGEIHQLTLHGLILMFAIGLFGTLGQLAVSRAYGRGHILVSAALQYTGVIFAALIGLVFWNERLSWQNWAGVSIVVSAGLLSTLAVKKAKK